MKDIISLKLYIFIVLLIGLAVASNTNSYVIKLGTNIYHKVNVIALVRY